jgi:hypothetical protein
MVILNAHKNEIRKVFQFLNVPLINMASISILMPMLARRNLKRLKGLFHKPGMFILTAVLNDYYFVKLKIIRFLSRSYFGVG